MRSVVVVLPASTCAMMPMLRMSARGVVRAIANFRYEFRGLDQENPGPRAFFERRMVVKNAEICLGDMRCPQVVNLTRKINGLRRAPHAIRSRRPAFVPAWPKSVDQFESTTERARTTRPSERIATETELTPNIRRLKAEGQVLRGRACSWCAG